MKIEWLFADATAVRFLDRADGAILGGISAELFCSIQAIFVDREPLCDVGTPS